MKFVNYDGFNGFTSETINIYFSESYFFPTDTFNSFGNLAHLNKTDWPKINIEIVDNDFTSLLTFEEASVGNMKIENMVIKYAGPAVFFYSSALEGSTVKRLEIKNSPRFNGFTPLNTSSTIAVNSLVIDTCESFSLSDNTIPDFEIGRAHV